MVRVEHVGWLEVVVGHVEAVHIIYPLAYLPHRVRGATPRVRATEEAAAENLLSEGVIARHN